jgi:hypothetical protein
MYLDIKAAPAVKATLNFAADRNDGGIWSNTDRSLITQALTDHVVEIRDARALSAGPSIAEQGFAVRQAPLEGADWTDEQWVTSIYMPGCVELVRELSGADYVVPMHNGVLVRDTGDVRRAPAAEFVHLDNSRDGLLEMAEGLIDAETRARFPRVTVFNVWRPLTPAPQDVPLALCDQRTLDPRDWVVGCTVEPALSVRAPYVTSIFNPAQAWWYLSDLTPDEAVVFKGFDSDRDAPFGCLHGAFRHPETPAGAVPRASAETRIFALFAN